MRLRVKREHMAYVHNRRYREGQIVDVPEKLLKKADQPYIDALEKQRAKELGPEQAKKHGLKVGAVVLPKWAELANKPIAPAPGIPGTNAGAGSPKVTPPPPEGPDPEGEAEAEAAAGEEEGAQKVL